MSVYNLQMITICSLSYTLVYALVIFHVCSKSIKKGTITSASSKHQLISRNNFGSYTVMAIIMYTTMFYFGCILAGASISFRTFYACAFISHFLTISQIPTFIQQINASKNINDIVSILYNKTIISNKSNKGNIMFMCMCIGLIVTSILFILDAGLQIQRYPIPILIGSCIGYVLGACFDLCHRLFQ